MAPRKKDDEVVSREIAGGETEGETPEELDARMAEVARDATPTAEVKPWPMLGSKMRVTGVARVHEGCENISLISVLPASLENEVFWRVELSLTNPGAFELFEVGQEFYVDFTEAP